MPRKFKKLSRRASRRPPKVRFVLVCEGENTEPRYFKALERKHRNVLIKIETIGPAGDPKNVAIRALKEKRNISRDDSYSKDDQVWAIFDRDEHKHYGQSIADCNKNGVNIARSNPCFEVWLILHFEDYNKAGTRKDAHKHLTQLCGGANCKKHGFDYTNIVENFEKAITRAKKQEANRKQEGGLAPPYTTVHKLVSELNKYFKK